MAQTWPILAPGGREAIAGDFGPAKQSGIAPAIPTNERSTYASQETIFSQASERAEARGASAGKT
jgi:hypothetical protein